MASFRTEDGRRVTVDQYGMMREEPDTRGMLDPVRCQCGVVYDTGSVHVIARYADCSVWITPCCKRQEDDRIHAGRIG